MRSVNWVNEDKAIAVKGCMQGTWQVYVGLRAYVEASAFYIRRVYQ